MAFFRGDVVGFFRFTFANGDEDDLRDPGFVIREEAAAVRWNGMMYRQACNVAGQILSVATSRLTC